MLFPVQSDVCSFRVSFASTDLFVGGPYLENGREGGVSEDEECFRCFERVSEGEEVSRGKKERVSEF